jgi:hypothetical protein
VPERAKVELLKIQYGNIYVQVPLDDAEAVAIAKAFLDFIEKTIREKRLLKKSK